MKIETITIKDFRGAVSLSLNFHNQLNVFFGNNGAGKTTILDALAIMLSWLVSRLKHPGASGRPIKETDITNGKSFAALEVIGKTSNEKVGWKIVRTRKGHITSKTRTSLKNLSDFAKNLQTRITQTNENVNLPLFVYYSVNRAVVDVPLRIREKHEFNLLAAYDDALAGGANFRTFFEWFREREDLENENRKYKDSLFKPEEFQFPDPHLQAVRSAINSFIPEFRNLSVRRSPLRMEVQKHGKTLTVNQLSDGEKCLMALVGDLARRMAIANPVRKNPLEGDGIVLIDEIDLHLHPKWQRTIVPNLVKTFPNCQFFISTHSPSIITHVQPESLHRLDLQDEGIVAEMPNESYGKNVDRILEDLMGLETTRPNHINTELRDLFFEIDEGRLQEAKRLIKNLRSDIGEDPELVKAEVLIKRKETIGR